MELSDYELMVSDKQTEKPWPLEFNNVEDNICVMDPMWQSHHVSRA